MAKQKLNELDQLATEAVAERLQQCIRHMESVWVLCDRSKYETGMLSDANDQVLDALRAVKAALPIPLRTQVQRILDLHEMYLWPRTRSRYFTLYEADECYQVCEYQDLEKWDDTSYRAVRGPFATKEEANVVQEQLNEAQFQLDLLHGIWVKRPVEDNVPVATSI